VAGSPTRGYSSAHSRGWLDMTERLYKGKCFCGTVEVAAAGAPVVMGYCHCDSCRKWSASPVSAFALWKAANVKINAGAESLGAYSKTANSVRKWCKLCGGHVMTEHPPLKLIDVYAGLLPELDFKPREHVHYQEAVLRIVDSLPKHKDLPKAAGGSGVLLPS
jgi:hypothetical protein